MPYLILLVKLSEGYCDNNLKRIIEITNKKLNSVEKIRKYYVIKNVMLRKWFYDSNYEIKKKYNF